MKLKSEWLSKSKRLVFIIPVSIIILLVLVFVAGKVDSRDTNKNVGNNNKKQKTSDTVSIITPVVRVKQIKVFFDNTGSMYPYERGSSNDFRQDLNDIFSFLNDIFKPTWKFYAVNNDVYYLHDVKLNSLIVNNRIYGGDVIPQEGTGDPTTTNYDLIFNKVLGSTSKNSLSILISDMIYSTENTDNISAKEISRDFGNVVKYIFQPYKDSMGIVLIKMSSPYRGYYWGNFSGAVRRQWINHNRPYYIMIMGYGETILKLIQKEREREGDENKKSLRNNKGFENYLTITSVKKQIYYSAFPNSIEDKHKVAFSFEDNEDGIHTLIKKSVDSSSQFLLGIDIRNIPVFPDFYKNMENYSFDENNYNVTYIGGCTPDKIVYIESEYIKTITDLFLVSVLNPDVKEFTISLKTKIPSWVEETNTYQDGLNGIVSTDQTVGFKGFVGGLWDAFYGNNIEETYFKAKINFN